METKKINVYEAPQVEVMELEIEQAVLSASNEETGNEDWL